MRRVVPFFVVVLCVFVILGCRTVKQSLDYYNACKGDNACVEEMAKAANTGKVVTSSVVAALPFGAGVPEVVGGVVGSVVAFFVGVSRGKKLRQL